MDEISVMESRHGPSTGASSYNPPPPPEVWASASPRDGHNSPVCPTHQPVLESGLLLLLLVLTLASLSLALSAALLMPQHPRAWPLGPAAAQLCRAVNQTGVRSPRCWPLARWQVRALGFTLCGPSLLCPHQGGSKSLCWSSLGSTAG